MAILVYTQNWDGKFKKQTFELISFAFGLSSQMNMPVIALSIGKTDEKELLSLGAYGASKVLKVEDDRFNNLDDRMYAGLIAEVARKTAARIVLFANNNEGKGLAPRVAVRLNAGLATGITRLPSSLDPFIVYKKIFSGKAFAHQVIRSDIKILTLSQNAFEVAQNPQNAIIEDYRPELDGSSALAVKHVDKQTGKILLTDAEIVVSGGRGMKAPENWGPIEELAGILGAATACSRPVSDEGWRPHEEHTGQTGKIIAPNLYFAFGISGAIQHLAGVSSSKCIVAVNTDKDAPIFEAADYGIIGDVHKVLPELIKAVREAKS